jgi:hypothetical protein
VVVVMVMMIVVMMMMSVTGHMRLRRDGSESDSGGQS